MRRPFLWLTLTIGLITLLAGSLYYARIDRFWGITQTDFSVFYHAGHQLDRGLSMYEHHPTHYTTNAEYLFKYAPPFGLAMIPLARFTVQTAIRWWYAITALALIGACWGIHGLVHAALVSRRHAWAINGLLLLSVLRPYLATLRLGQVDVVLAGCLIAFLVALHQRRDALAGWWLGIPILCKLVPSVWLLYLAATRRWRTLGWTLIAVLSYLASPLLRLGVAGTRRAIAEWLGVLNTSRGNLEWLLRYKNQSVVSAVLRVVAGPHAETATSAQVAVALGITGVLGLLYAGLVWRAVQRSCETSDPLQTLAAPSLVMIGMVVFSPHAWIATFIHLLLPYGVLITHLVTRAPRDRIGWGLLGVSFLLVSATAPDAGLGSSLSHTVHFLTPMLWGALCLAAGVWRLVGECEVRVGR